MITREQKYCLFSNNKFNSKYLYLQVFTLIPCNLKFTQKNVTKWVYTEALCSCPYMCSCRYLCSCLYVFSVYILNVIKVLWHFFYNKMIHFLNENSEDSVPQVWNELALEHYVIFVRLGFSIIYFKRYILSINFYSVKNIRENHEFFFAANISRRKLVFVVLVFIKISVDKAQLQK